MTQKKYSWTTQEQPPKMSGGHLWDWRAYKYWQNFPSSGLGNCRVLAHIINVLCMWQVNSKEKKFSTSHWEISVSCTSQEFNNVIAPCSSIHAIIITCQVVTYGKNNWKFHTFSSKSGCGRLQEVPNRVILLENFWYYEKLVTEERLSQPEIWLYDLWYNLQVANEKVQ